MRKIILFFLAVLSLVILGLATEAQGTSEDCAPNCGQIQNIVPLEIE